MNKMFPILSVCQGVSDEAFLQELIEKRKLNGIGVWKLEFDKEPPDQTGVSGFNKRLKSMVTATGLGACKLVIVIADNDSDPDKKFADVLKEIEKAGHFGIPTKRRKLVKPLMGTSDNYVPDILVLMLPWDSKLGALETMCFSAAATIKPNLASCVHKFTKCGKANKWPISKLSKLQVRCMLSLLCPDNPDISFKWSWNSSQLTIYPWPVKHREFSTVAKYLRSLCKKYC